MISKRLGGLCAALGLALGLGACVDDYGYGGLSVGYGNAGYYGDAYDDGYGYGYGGYGYAPSWYGWYGDYYYPGSGIYVYDSYRRPYRWNDTQRRYWTGQQRFRGRDGNPGNGWNGFDRRPGPGRGYNAQGTPGRNGFVPGNRGYRGNPNFQGDRGNGPVGYRGNPGFRSNGVAGNPGFRNNGGVGNAPARPFQANPGFRGNGPGNRVFSAPQGGRGGGQAIGRGGGGRSGGGARQRTQ